MRSNRTEEHVRWGSHEKKPDRRVLESLCWIIVVANDDLEKALSLHFARIYEATHTRLLDEDGDGVLLCCSFWGTICMVAKYLLLCRISIILLGNFHQIYETGPGRWKRKWLRASSDDDTTLIGLGVDELLSSEQLMEIPATRFPDSRWSRKEGTWDSMFVPGPRIPIPDPRAKLQL